MFRSLSLCSAIALAAALSLPSAPAQALTMKECSAKYQDAKAKDALKGMKWNDFRKAECADDDASEADAAAAEKEVEAKPASTAAKPNPSTTTTAPNGTPAPKATSAAKPAAGGKLSFPTSVSDKYSTETPGKARMHTCLDQYRANKEAGVEQPNWIAKGGGYYSQCNAKLKEGA
ncbi:hypothetical protein [Chenggangzhangella methanolivorans]|uniref:Uncharacterized protein n=1 Tax=Chenggangzhangella methanolivorans TaxID=1437009 RepID=A0A9E6RDY2_9HYPH|nr:hypothetical protein [Chenggangzhangella methanolivorans]QZO02175.1 hypothetical protein K6K41_13525 [Chenggangzhangella methanolivorans]